MLIDAMKRLLLVLLLASTAWAVNDFSSDGNCKAVWNVDNGALTTDSKGTNTLTNSGMANDAVNFKQGDASADADALGDILYCVDGDLDAGFPFKSGDATKKVSVCGWFRTSGFPAAADRMITGKYSAASGGRSWMVYCKKNANWNLSLAIGYNSGDSAEIVSHASTIATGIWYHFGITFDDSDKSYRIRIWDDNAGAILGSDLTGTATNNMYAGTGLFHIGRCGSASNCLGGEKDEVVVFNDILTTGEIDQIRAGTYGAAASTASQVIMATEEDG
jgi:hypothetical protein